MTITATHMTEAAVAFLDALSAGQRAAATFPLDDDAERTRWAYFPSDFHGIALGAMDARQQKLAHALVASALSLHAYAKLTTIAALDNVLDVIEGRRRSAVRDPARYFVSVFGAPTDPAWAWRFEGHHISLHFAIAAGEVISPTPIFFGANPADVEHHGRTGSPAPSSAPAERRRTSAANSSSRSMPTAAASQCSTTSHRPTSSSWTFPRCLPCATSS